MNLEHTMVRIGGRGTSDNPVGNLAVVGVGEEKNENYLVRLDNYDILNNKHIIIDYSILNVIHMATCGQFPDFSKMTCVPPFYTDPQTFLLKTAVFRV
jgi:hypothetical protein